MYRPHWQDLAPLPGHTWRFMRLVYARFGEDRLNRVAQALSYTTVLSIVPLTTLVFGLFSVFPVFQKWMMAVQTFVYSHFVPASGDVVQKYLNEFASKSAQLTAAGLAFLIVTALMLMATIEQTFNDIWRVLRKRKAMYRFLTYWAILTLGPLLLGLSLSLTSALVAPASVRNASFFMATWAGFLRLLPLLIEVAAFVLLYTVVPNVAIKWRHAVTGSLFTVVLFEIAKSGFATMVLEYSSYTFVYGALAALPVFLIWVYVSWAIVLLGAVVVALAPQWGGVTPAQIRRAEAAAEEAQAGGDKAVRGKSPP